MKSIKILFAMWILYFPCQLSSKIIETYHLVEVMPFVNEKTWCLLDLDNTFFEGKQALGHADWFYDELQKRIKQGMTKEQAMQDLYPEWIKVQQICPVKSLEANTVSLLSELQKKGVVMMGVTHRHTTVVDATLRQVQSLGFDFQQTAPWKEDLIVPAKHPTLYTQGILFVCDLNSKGDVFQQFLALIEQKPQKIVFIDDKRKNVEEMEAMCEREGIEYIGVFYRAIEKADKVFSAEIAAFQYHFLEKILSNDAAIVLMDEGIKD